MTRMKHACLFAWQASIWSGWKVTFVAPRIVNNVSNVTKIKHASHFACQAQFLVRLDNDTCCSSQCQ